MRYRVHVKTNAGTESVVLREDGSLSVSVKAPAREGKANARLEKVIAKHFRVAPSLIRIVSGASSRRKVVDVPE